MKTIEERIRDWQQVVAKISDAPDQRYHDGRLAGISESLSIAQRYTKELEELYGVDGCSTGDCPHDNVNDCVKSQAEDIAQQAKHIATLTAEIAALKANAAKPAKAETQNSAAKPRYFKPRRESPVFASLAPQKIQDGKSYRFNRDGPFVGWRYNLTEVGPDLMAALAENFVEVPTESEATAGF